MQPIPLAGPAVEPITLPEARAFLRLDGTEEDELLAALIAAARLTVERATRRLLVAQSWRLELDRWPPGRVVVLPLAPVLAIEAVRITDAAGAATTVDSADLRLEPGDPARLLVSAVLPEPGWPRGGVAIDLLCGYGATAASVPEPLRLAVRQLVAHWFERRGDEPGGDAGGLPAGIAALLAPFRRPRLAP